MRGEDVVGKIEAAVLVVIVDLLFFGVFDVGFRVEVALRSVGLLGIAFLKALTHV